jgi:hypothetical protein
MTQTKKYRRRVSETRKECAARGIADGRFGNGTWEKMHSSERDLHLAWAQFALEADAEVVEFESYTCWHCTQVYLEWFRSPCGKTYRAEQFHAEWEEIPSV